MLAKIKRRQKYVFRRWTRHPFRQDARADEADTQPDSNVRGSKTPGYVVGVVSDTHGLIRPEALQLLRGSDVIVHCGDVGAPGVLDSLRATVCSPTLRRDF